MPGPIDASTEAIAQFIPEGVALITCVFGMRVNPMLKGVHGGNPGKEPDNTLQMRAPRPDCILLTIEFPKVLVADQFHTHRSNLAEFQRRMLIVMQILLLRCQRMESMACLV